MNTIIDKIDLWTTAQELKTSNRGRSASNQSLLGIKKLRALILDLAVRGKLVIQDSKDEPASKLLERIATEKARLIRDKKIKGEPNSKSLKDIPFELPENWKWCYLNDLGVITSSSRVHQKDWQVKGIPFYRAREIVLLSKFGYVNNDLFITEELYCQHKENGFVPEENDIMITGVGTIGIPYVVKKEDQFYFKDASVLIFKNLFKLYPKYLELFFNSLFWVKEIHKESMGTTVDTLTISRAKIVPIAVPPLAEQHRIVVKVDELMALCDELETQQTSCNVAHETLVATLLLSLTKAENSNSFDESWQRIANHFDILFTTEHSIDQLKKTILQLAVMGKLAPQNLEDEPVSELLKKIAKEKAKLIKEGKIKKQSALPEISDDEKPFDLPEGWEWVRLGSYGIVFSGNSFKSEDFNEDSGTKVIKITNAGVGDFVETNDYLPSSFFNEYEQYVVKENDLILALTRPYISTGLKISKCPKSYNNSLLNQRVAAIRVNTGLDYVFLFLQSSFVLNLYMERFGNSGLQPNLKVSDVTELILPIPPLAEQQRIVSKVDELFTLCDELKERHVEAQTLQNHMAVAVVEQAMQ